MGLLSIIRKIKKEKDLRILMVGLDNFRKTIIVLKINGEDTAVISPTLGFNIKTIKYQNAIGETTLSRLTAWRGLSTALMCGDWMIAGWSWRISSKKSAYTGEGLFEGFDWLVQDVASQIYVID